MPGQADRNPNPDPTPRDGSTPDAKASAVAAPNADGELVLVKHGHRYVFKCTPGAEKQLLDQLAALAGDPKHELTWFDAAILSHQMGRKFGQTLNQMNKAS